MSISEVKVGNLIRVKVGRNIILAKVVEILDGAVRVCSLANNKEFNVPESRVQLDGEQPAPANTEPQTARLWERPHNRAFNGTTHAGHAKHCCVLALLIAAKAKTAKCASTKKPREYNEESAAYDLRVFLLHLKAVGPEFKYIAPR